MTPEPLDRLLEDDFLVSSDSDDLDGQTYPLRVLFSSRDGLKFMLFEVDGGDSYIRLQVPPNEREHDHIVTRFNREAMRAGIDYDNLNPRGGGDIQASRTNGKTELTFCSVSDVYGRFDKNLLRSLMDAHLDKRVDYRIL